MTFSRIFFFFSLLDIFAFPDFSYYYSLHFHFLFLFFSFSFLFFFLFFLSFAKRVPWNTDMKTMMTPTRRASTTYNSQPSHTHQNTMSNSQPHDTQPPEYTINHSKKKKKEIKIPAKPKPSHTHQNKKRTYILASATIFVYIYICKYVYIYLPYWQTLYIFYI